MTKVDKNTVDFVGSMGYNAYMMTNKAFKMSTDQINPPGFYVGKRILGRYQVLESTILKGSYFIYDHETEDNLRSKDGSTHYFASVAMAETHVKGKRK